MADGDISLPTNIFTSKEFIAIIVVISLSIIVKFTLGSYENKTIIFIIFEIILYIILAYIFIANLLYLLFGIEITTTIYNAFTDNPTIEIDIETEVEDILDNNEEEKKEERQVFHVSGNKYRYEDAEPICKALGAELANYDNIEEAYKKGVNGVDMDSPKDKWLSSLHRKKHGKNYKMMKKQKIIVEDLVLMVGILIILI